jgi:hypothetical protein
LSDVCEGADLQPKQLHLKIWECASSVKECCKYSFIASLN